ncbi:MAG TPA: hypothetical protein VLI54_05970 [Bacillota bacterium]|nr:hypothetical protein [Bacillota bacterium]
MREVERQIKRPRPVLRRAADGSLRAASGDVDVADIWAERDRIRLADAIERDRRKAEKKQKRRFGMFGSQAAPTAPGAPKEIEIKISLPKLHLADKLHRIRLPKLSRKQWATALAAGLLAVFVIGTRGMYDKSDKPASSAHTGGSAVSGATATTNSDEKPEFTTILPANKTIEDLGGWGRVSPPSSDPVFAYSDQLGGVHIVVSEQQMPDSFSGSIDSHVRQVAKQFGSTKKIQSRGGITAYTGTASNGAGSVIFAKKQLLVLIRSTSLVNELSWGDYIDDLE